ncbi:Nitrilotriacetate monooxygenase component A [Variovorax sp. PBS-H4]|uniref:LLM class flavin-dependent oxidoreductase n=1 Tax=Variovorax sp. PBS-H4 TaxID=434008 RepID=UPI0013194993|nr:LLM class flavin-dependent oxidoreductase [Variovorax sp. PBS-H4]VTU40261.1 Nitrilotriacetate monooxygenase component A [Variovorax sp. PBS-H4]
MRNIKTEKLKLGGLFHPTGNHVASWLHPDTQLDAGSNFRHYVELAHLAEKGKFDLMFLADAAAVRGGDLEALSRWPQYMAYFEPTTLLAALAAVTSHIGLVATATTSYNEPYNIARRYASLDHISGGRAGWNVVTSSNLDESKNFGHEEHLQHGDRYARAKEFASVVRGLWDSWEDDAFVRDREKQRYFEPAKLHVLGHKGTYFSVRGPLNISRPPQGHPVIAQAGSSEPGKELAAETADIVFTAQGDLEGAKNFYSDLKSRMSKFGRDPQSLKIMPGLNPIVGRTEGEAKEKHAYLQSLIHPSVGLELLSNAIGGVDLKGIDIDKPLPTDFLDRDTNTSKSTLEGVMKMAQRDNLTVRQLYERFAGARGQRTLVGTAEQIALDMRHWFESAAVDGFLIQPADLPNGLKDFVHEVVPALQHMGVFRTEYEGTTLRENLDLPRPANQFTAATTNAYRHDQD